MKSKRFVTTVDESNISDLINDLYMNHPDQVDTVIKWYSKASGIDVQYIDLRTAIHGYLCS